MALVRTSALMRAAAVVWATAAANGQGDQELFGASGSGFPDPEETTWQCAKEPFGSAKICTEMSMTDCQKKFPNSGCAANTEPQCETDNYDCEPVTFSCYEDKKDEKWGCKKGGGFSANKTSCQMVDDDFQGKTYGSQTACEVDGKNACKKGETAPPISTPTRCVKQVNGKPVNLTDAKSFKVVGVNHSSLSDCEQQRRARKCAEPVPTPPVNGGGNNGDKAKGGDTTMKILLGVAGGLGLCAVIGAFALAKRGALPCGRPGAKPDPRSELDAPIISDSGGDLDNVSGW